MTHTLVTGPLGAAGRSRIEAGIRRCHDAAGVPWPGVVEWTPSPFTGNVVARRLAGAAQARRAEAAVRALPWYRRVSARVRPAAGKAGRNRYRLGVEELARTAERLRAACPAPPVDAAQAAVWAAIRASLREPPDLAPLHTADAPVCWWPHPEFVVVSEPPVEVHARPAPGGGWEAHHGTEPAIRWADDWGLVFWRGIHLPHRPREESFFDHLPEEVRRATVERMGWDAYTGQLGMRPVARQADPARPAGELLLHVRSWGAVNDLTSLATADGAGRVHVTDLPGDADDPVAAAAWEYGVAVEVYRRSARGPDDELVDPVTGEIHRRRPDVSGRVFQFEP